MNFPKMSSNRNLIPAIYETVQNIINFLPQLDIVGDNKTIQVSETFHGKTIKAFQKPASASNIQRYSEDFEPFSLTNNCILFQYYYHSSDDHLRRICPGTKLENVPASSTFLQMGFYWVSVNGIECCMSPKDGSERATIGGRGHCIDVNELLNDLSGVQTVLGNNVYKYDYVNCIIGIEASRECSVLPDAERPPSLFPDQGPVYYYWKLKRYVEVDGYNMFNSSGEENYMIRNTSGEFYFATTTEILPPDNAFNYKFGTKDIDEETIIYKIPVCKVLVYDCDALIKELQQNPTNINLTSNFSIKINNCNDHPSLMTTVTEADINRMRTHIEEWNTNHPEWDWHYDE